MPQHRSCIIQKDGNPHAPFPHRPFSYPPYHATEVGSLSSPSICQNPPLSHRPPSANASSTTALAPSTGSLLPIHPLKAVLQCPGLTTPNQTSLFALAYSSVKAFSATFDME
jgi:hypothetical protein